ncbi:MAG: tetratricopeptide repeat protein [Pseudobdellovibrionaceae bacterium]|nr:tetratricopeptide repeat protein [Pseudobdellovibrionaceae bacterium]
MALKLKCFWDSRLNRATALIIFYFIIFCLSSLMTKSLLAQTEPNSEKTLLTEDSLNIVDAAKVRIRVKSTLRLDYLSPRWNTSPGIDSGFIVIRNLVDLSLIYIELKETSGNSSMFTGIFQVSEQSAKELTIEIYVPPKNLTPSPNSVKQLAKMITDGIITRKPYFYRVENGEQKITIYDSKIQALEAYRYFVRFGTSREVLNPNLLETSANAQLSGSSPQSLTQVGELESQLAQDVTQQRLKFVQKNDKEKERLKQESLKFAQQGLKAYQEENYLQAKENFEKAIAHDPTNKSFFFQYGVTLYRLQEYDLSIAYLNQVEDVHQEEKSLFLAMNYMKKSEFQLAQSLLTNLTKNSEFQPTAYLYLGIIALKQDLLEEATDYFKKVLETSTQIELDSAAESYLDQIENLKKTRAGAKNRFTISGNLGAMYNSNILTVSPDALPTDLAGFRVSYGFHLEYRPVFTNQKEIAAQIMVSDLYSTDSRLAAQEQFQKFDPLTIQVSLPFRFKKQQSEQSEKARMWSVMPFFRSVQMDFDSQPGRETILTSFGALADFTVSQGAENHLYGMEIRKDNSLIAPTSPEANQNTIFLGVNTVKMLPLPNSRLAQSGLIEAGVGFNQAEGRNQTFQQVTLGAGLADHYFSSLVILKAGATYRLFPNHLIGRQDIVLNAQLMSQKQLSPKLMGALGLSYLTSHSSQSLVNFNQLIILGQLIWQAAF